MFDKLRLLTFDLDDTLWATAPVILAAEHRLHRWLMLHAPETVKKPFHRGYAQAAARLDGEQSVPGP